MSDICSECGVDPLDVDILSRELDQLRAENIALALQVKALLQQFDYFRQPDNLKETSDKEYREWVISLSNHYLSTTDNSAAIIAAHDAEVRKDALIEAADWFDGVMQNDYANPEDELRRMAGEVKG